MPRNALVDFTIIRIRDQVHSPAEAPFLLYEHAEASERTIVWIE